MSESPTVTAHIVGNPAGVADNPWPPGHPVEGERVAVFAFDVVGVDGQSQDIRTYHVAPADQAAEGVVVPDHRDPQGTVVRWTAYGTGTVITPPATMGIEAAMMDPDRAADAMFVCTVRPDDPGFPSE
ncbi:hypothetical protein [Nocardia stercoris]|uniref:Uncharacterized protein n=1 Tax=Nocardia stercoris TaxID=2483361 RepID=A0A3M2KYK3_9NOCA|nr:hypothetical protein [Nocardia stercoris]RMI30569.1 hypothetical protein EBN03_21065 [Nocardia stercoris]